MSVSDQHPIRIDQSATERMQATARRLASSPENRKKALHEVLRENVLDENGLWESEAARTRYYAPEARASTTDEAETIARTLEERCGLTRALDFLAVCVVPATRYSRDRAARSGRTSYGWKHEAERGDALGAGHSYTSNGAFLATCLMCGVELHWDSRPENLNRGCCIVAPERE